MLFESGVDVVAQDVHDMYRWLNLDYAIGGETDPKYDDRLWVGWPDAEHSDANVVFVHGYNVHPSEAWDWSQAMTPPAWRPYPDRVRSSHWYELFADAQGDERSRLMSKCFK